MRLVLEALPGEAAAKAGELLRAIAEDLAPASDAARMVLEALDDADVDVRSKRPLRNKSLEGLRAKLQRIVDEELRDLEGELVDLPNEMSKALTEAQRTQLRALVRRAWLRVLGRGFGVQALTTDERTELGKLKQLEALEAAFASGVRAAKGEEPATLMPEEQLSRQAALEHAGTLVRGLADRAADRYSQAFDVEDLREETAGAIERREAPKTLVANLRRASGDLGRDWDRVAVTELQDAHNRGRARAIKERSEEDDPEVYKVTAPDACGWCVRLHTGPDGQPRIFRLSTLEAHATNVGRRKSEWQACVGPIHPHCQCELIYLAPGWGFDEDGDAVPGGELGVRYDSEAALSKALVDEAAFQKAARIGGRVDFRGLPINVEANAGDVRTWRSPTTGKTGQTVLRHAYGEIVGTRGADGDPVDVYLGPDPTARCAYVVDQLDPKSGEFDEQKVMLGFSNPHAAEHAYKQHYPEPFYGGIAELDFDEFCSKLDADDADGVLKGDAEERRYNVGTDDRGWRVGGGAAMHSAAERKMPQAQRPADKATSLIQHEQSRIAANKRRKHVIPTAVFVVNSRTLSDPAHVKEPPERPHVNIEERSKEIERNRNQLDTRIKNLRAHARPDPNLARIGSVTPSVPVDLGSS